MLSSLPCFAMTLRCSSSAAAQFLSCPKMGCQPKTELLRTRKIACETTCKCLTTVMVHESRL
jgi:hypothetical protein